MAAACRFPHLFRARLATGAVPRAFLSTTTENTTKVSKKTEAASKKTEAAAGTTKKSGETKAAKAPKKEKVSPFQLPPAPTLADFDLLLKEYGVKEADVEREKAARDCTFWIPPQDVRTLDDKTFRIHEHGKRIQLMASHNHIFQDIFDKQPFTPTKNFLVSFGDTLLHRGNIIPQAVTLNKPSIKFSSGEDELWTVCLLNPDGCVGAPNSSVIHWLVANIRNGDVANGKELVPYLPPVPFESTGYHRLVAVLLRQSTEYEWALPSASSEHNFLGERTVQPSSIFQSLSLVPHGLAFAQLCHDPAVTIPGLTPPKFFSLRS